MKNSNKGDLFFQEKEMKGDTYFKKLVVNTKSTIKTKDEPKKESKRDSKNKSSDSKE